ncbi:MAG: carboxymuconolactone decarboxylase family protein [Terracidiphilus sp.]|jgi:carboxymuconolactone decarboxylase family protein
MSLDEKVRELIAVGASIAVTNPPEVKYRISRARELGVQDDELKEAIEIGRLVRFGASSKTDLFASSLATTPTPQERGGCRKAGGRGQGGGCGGDGPAHQA